MRACSMLISPDARRFLMSYNPRRRSFCSSLLCVSASEVYHTESVPCSLQSGFQFFCSSTLVPNARCGHVHSIVFSLRLKRIRLYFRVPIELALVPSEKYNYCSQCSHPFDLFHLDIFPLGASDRIRTLYSWLFEPGIGFEPMTRYLQGSHSDLTELTRRDFIAFYACLL